MYKLQIYTYILYIYSSVNYVITDSNEIKP